MSQGECLGWCFVLLQLQKPDMAIRVVAGLLWREGGRKGLKWLGSHTCAAAETSDGCQHGSWALVQVVGEGSTKGIWWLVSAKAFIYEAKDGELCRGPMEVMLVIGFLSGTFAIFVCRAGFYDPHLLIIASALLSCF